MKTHHTKDNPCPKCQKILTAVTCTTEDHNAPKPGDVTVCVYCESALEFTDDLSLMLASPETLADAEVAADIKRSVEVVRLIKQNIH